MFNIIVHKGDLQASSAGSSDAFSAGVKRILYAMESLAIKFSRKGPRSSYSIGVQEGKEIAQTLSNMSISERQRVFHLFGGMQGASRNPTDPFNAGPSSLSIRTSSGAPPPSLPKPDESILRERLSYMRALAEELLDGTGQGGTRAATAPPSGTSGDIKFGNSPETSESVLTNPFAAGHLVIPAGQQFY